MSAQQRLLDYAPPASLLADDVVLLTGASRGIGRAVCLAAAACGAQMIVMARNVKQLEQLADEIVAAGGREPGIIPVNLEGATVDDYVEFARLIEARYGRLNGLVLNAGTLGEMAPLATYDPLTWARVFQINVHSQFLLLQAMLPLMNRGDHGSIIFTSSGVGRHGRAYWGAYAATKFANEGMMQVLADELESNSPVRVNALNPGRVRTEMRATAYPAEDPTTLALPAAVANAYLFLLGPDSGDINGQSLDAQTPRQAPA
ncbi:MAG: YciK family oxidoreductase [Gammaproteobacteria bacterium]